MVAINWWAWLAGLSLWLAVGMTTLPSVCTSPRPHGIRRGCFGVMSSLECAGTTLGAYALEAWVAMEKERYCD